MFLCVRMSTFIVFVVSSLAFSLVENVLLLLTSLLLTSYNRKHFFLNRLGNQNDTGNNIYRYNKFAIN